MKYLFLAVILCLGGLTYATQSTTNETKKLTSVTFDASNPVMGEMAPGRTLNACTVDNPPGVPDEAGTMCVNGHGTTCKKVSPCKALESLGSAQQFFTQEELAQWPNVDIHSNTAFIEHLISIGYIDEQEGGEGE